MGIQINGNTDTISAIDGGLTVSGASLGSASASSLNISGIVTASSFSGPLTGNITGNVAGNLTGNVTGNVNATGLSTFSGGVVVAAGTTAAPSISPTGDSNTGIFFPSADTVCIGEGGTEVIRVDSSGRVGVGTNRVTRPFEVWAGTAGTSFSVDSSGRVQMPFQPAFNAQGTGTLAFSGAQVYTKITIASNITPNTSNSYANSRFTAPVSGNYLFFLSSATTTATSTGPAILLYKNGVATQEIAINYSNVSYTQFGGSIIRSAAPGDYFEFYISNYNSTSFTIDLARTCFGGYLIG